LSDIGSKKLKSTLDPAAGGVKGNLLPIVTGFTVSVDVGFVAPDPLKLVKVTTPGLMELNGAAKLG
jgi:ATP-dependent protease HslVU (ClpYQ) ATPase subunit